jgi:hypothetical protein
MREYKSCRKNAKGVLSRQPEEKIRPTIKTEKEAREL